MNKQQIIGITNTIFLFLLWIMLLPFFVETFTFSFQFPPNPVQESIVSTFDQIGLMSRYGMVCFLIATTILVFLTPTTQKVKILSITVCITSIPLLPFIFVYLSQLVNQLGFGVHVIVYSILSILFVISVLLFEKAYYQEFRFHTFFTIGISFIIGSYLTKIYIRIMYMLSDQGIYIVPQSLLIGDLLLVVVHITNAVLSGITLIMLMIGMIFQLKSVNRVEINSTAKNIEK